MFELKFYELRQIFKIDMSKVLCKSTDPKVSSNVEMNYFYKISTIQVGKISQIQKGFLQSSNRMLLDLEIDDKFIATLGKVLQNKYKMQDDSCNQNQDQTPKYYWQIN